MNMLIVLPRELIYKYIEVNDIPLLPRSSDIAALVELKDGRTYVCQLANGIYIVAALGCSDGIPFGIEDIVNITKTDQEVDWDTVGKRWKQLESVTYADAMIHGALPPGNYKGSYQDYL